MVDPFTALVCVGWFEVASWEHRGLVRLLVGMAKGASAGAG